MTGRDEQLLLDFLSVDEAFKNFIYDEENLTEEDKAFANELLDAFYANESEINEIIANLAKGYKLERIYTTDNQHILHKTTYAVLYSFVISHYICRRTAGGL